MKTSSRATLAAALLVAAFRAVPALAEPAVSAVPRASSDSAPAEPPASADSGPAKPRASTESTTRPESPASADAHAEPLPLTGDSTLAEWRKASSNARSQVAVALAKNRLPPEATKLDVAKMAMEISGCLSATAKDSRLGGWKVAPTATTCLTAPEREPEK